MCDADQLSCSAADRLAAKLSHTVLSNDVVNIILGSGYYRAGSQDILDTAYLAACCGRGECDKALAALGMGRTLYVVYLAAGTGDMLGTYGLCRNLCAVDGHEIIQLSDNSRIIYIVNRKDFHPRVVVDVIIDLLGTECKCCYGIAAVVLLAVLAGAWVVIILMAVAGKVSRKQNHACE